MNSKQDNSIFKYEGGWRLTAGGWVVTAGGCKWWWVVAFLDLLEIEFTSTHGPLHSAVVMSDGLLPTRRRRNELIALSAT